MSLASGEARGSAMLNEMSEARRLMLEAAAAREDRLLQPPTNVRGAAAKNIEMFNLHELAIFKRVGLTPVFFGEALGGAKMPNLTYMLVFPDEDGRKDAWNRFRTDEAWVKLKALPEYADKEIVSRITNKILTPEAYSEI